MSTDLENLHISVEFAHPSEYENNETIDTGISLAYELKSHGYDVEAYMFVDDVNLSQSKNAGFWRGIMTSKWSRIEKEFEGEDIKLSLLLESDMITRGLSLVDEIRQGAEAHPEARQSQNGRTINWRSGKQRQRIKLLGYENHPDLPSCEVMDLACYERKLGSADITVTIIDERYRPQQQRVRILAEILGWSMPVLVSYVDTKSKTICRESWFEEPPGLLGKL